MFRKIALGLILASIANLALAQKGLIVNSTTKDLINGGASSTVIYMTADQMLIENSGAQNNSIIFEPNAELLTILDHSKKEYYRFDKATLMQLKQQLKMVVQTMKQFASQMPEAERKKLDKFLNPGGGKLIDYQMINHAAKVGDWNTVLYRGTSNNTKLLEMDIVSFEELGISKEKFNVMAELINYFKTHLKEVIALMPSGGSFSQLSFDENSPVMNKGIPVKTIAFKDGRSNSENIVRSIEQGEIAKEKFSVPSGYQAKSIDLQQQMGR